MRWGHSCSKGPGEGPKEGQVLGVVTGANRRLREKLTSQKMQKSGPQRLGSHTAKQQPSHRDPRTGNNVSGSTWWVDLPQDLP